VQPHTTGSEDWNGNLTLLRGGNRALERRHDPLLRVQQEGLSLGAVPLSNRQLPEPRRSNQ